jgi:hypothetical protein
MTHSDRYADVCFVPAETSSRRKKQCLTVCRGRTTGHYRDVRLLDDKNASPLQVTGEASESANERLTWMMKVEALGGGLHQGVSQAIKGRRAGGSFSIMVTRVFGCSRWSVMCAVDMFKIDSVSRLEW